MLWKYVWQPETSRNVRLESRKRFADCRKGIINSSYGHTNLETPTPAMAPATETQTPSQPAWFCEAKKSTCQRTKTDLVLFLSDRKIAKNRTAIRNQSVSEVRVLGHSCMATSNTRVGNCVTCTSHWNWHWGILCGNGEAKRTILDHWRSDAPQK